MAARLIFADCNEFRSKNMCRTASRNRLSPFERPIKPLFQYRGRLPRRCVFLLTLWVEDVTIAGPYCQVRLVHLHTNLPAFPGLPCSFRVITKTVLSSKLLSDI